MYSEWIAPVEIIKPGELAHVNPLTITRVRPAVRGFRHIQSIACYATKEAAPEALLIMSAFSFAIMFPGVGTARAKPTMGHFAKGL